MPLASYRDPVTGQYVPILGGSGNAFSGAQVSSSAPTPRGVGDLWVDTSVPALEWDTTWKTATLLNGWVIYGHPFGLAVEYRKTAGGLVVVKGLVKNGSTSHVTTLPPGYRPNIGLILPTVCQPNVMARLNVGSDGTLVFETYSNVWASVCCTFYADA